MVAEWRAAAAERDRGPGNCFFLLFFFTIWGPKGGAGRRKGGNSGRQKGPIGGQSLRVRGSIWKGTLCLALYCTPCCFNQWQACSQGLQQQWLFLVVSLLLFPAPLNPDAPHRASEGPRGSSGGLSLEAGEVDVPR